MTVKTKPQAGKKPPKAPEPEVVDEEEVDEGTPGENPEAEAEIEEEDDFEEIPGDAPQIKRANAQAAKFRQERNAAREEMKEMREQLKIMPEIKAELDAQKKAREKAEGQALTAAKDAAKAKHNLPDELAARLVGSTPEEIAADAEKIAKALPQPQPDKGAGKKPLPTGNPAGGSGLTLDQLKAMSPAEVAKIPREERHKILSGG